MNLDDLAREATRELLDVTAAGVVQRRTELDRERRRRRLGGAAVLVVACALIAGWLVLVTTEQGDREDVRPVRPTGQVHNGALVTVNGAGFVHVLDGELPDSAPREVHALSEVDFTSDGTRMMTQDEDGSLHLVDIRTGESIALGDCSTTWCDADLSPAGDVVAVSPGGRDSSIEIRPVGGGPIDHLPTPGAYAPSWAPDGARLTFNTEDGLFLIGREGSGIRLLWPSSSEATAMMHPASWSPDGSRVAFLDTEAWNDKASGNIVPLRFTLTVLNLESGATELSRYVGGCYCLGISAPQFAWSPDGSLIAVSVVYNGRRDRLGAAHNGGVYVVRPDGSGWRQLTGESATRGLTWQPSAE